MDKSVILMFIAEHWIDILIIALAVGALGIFIRRALTKKDGIAKKIIYGLVLSAEAELGSKTGQIKKQQVLSWFYSNYPVIALFVPQKTADLLIEEAVKHIDKVLKDTDKNLYDIMRGGLNADL